MDDGRQDASRATPGAAGCRHGGLRLPRSSRLSAAGYRVVFDAGRSCAGRLMVLWWCEGADGGGRVGTVASKRSLRRAVARNRARRLLREAYRLNRPDLESGVDIVLVARTRIADKACAEVAEEFRRLCRLAGIWRGRS